MSIIAMIVVSLVFIFGAVIAFMTLLVIGRNVARKLKDTNVNLKDGVNSDELATIGRLLAEEAAASKELELLSRLKDVAEKALMAKVKS